MKTYQDFLEIKEKSDRDRIDFIRAVINEHVASDEYKNAIIAEEYDTFRNRTIVQYQKLLYTISGQAVPDSFSANYKIPSRFFSRFITQEAQYLLGNGVTWGDGSEAEKLGADFDTQLQKAGRYALRDRVAYGFFNLDHVEVFQVKEFAPLYDEENGAIRAGVRFWQIDAKKPLRATLYEEDGYTEYIWNQRIGHTVYTEGREYSPKRTYMLKVAESPTDGVIIYDGENYPSFPIVPLWGNSRHQSELVGLRAGIDAYDLIKSGFANDLDDASQIYWILENQGGMDDVDLAQFLDRMRTVKAASINSRNGAKAEAHTLEVPYNSREALLDRIRRDLYEDAMALDTRELSSGADTATQIKAAYEPLNSKADEFEYCVIEFIDNICKVAGIEGEAPTFTRSVIVNTGEEIQNIVAASSLLPDDYITRKLLELLGDGDQAEEILNQMAADELSMADNTESEVQENPVTE